MVKIQVILAVLMSALLPVGTVMATEAEDEARHALVIGNADYVMSPLENPVNDAADMSKALRRLGFEVTTLINADLRQMRRAAIDFGKKLQKDGGVGLFYYAGHGMQVEGENYLIPLEAAIEVEDHVPVEALSVNQILARMGGARNRMNIVVLDACRNNPLSRSMRSGVKGLAQLDAPFGTYISFATAPGQTAYDGDGRNGLYTSALLKALDKPGLKIEETFKQVRKQVVTATDSGQVPWTSSSIVGDFIFQAEAEEIDLEFEEEKTAQNPVVTVDPRETALWAAVQQGGQITDYQTYLSVYPDGVYAVLAQARMANLNRQEKDRSLEKTVKDAEVSQLQDQLAALRKREEQQELKVSEEKHQIDALKKQIEQLAAQQAKLASRDKATPNPSTDMAPAQQATILPTAKKPVQQRKYADLSLKSRLHWQGEWTAFGLKQGRQTETGDWENSEGKIGGNNINLTLTRESADEIFFKGTAGRKDNRVRGVLKRQGDNLFVGKWSKQKRTGLIVMDVQLRVENLE